jgi:large subunit ribosomal protein L7/L12
LPWQLPLPLLPAPPWVSDRGNFDVVLRGYLPRQKIGVIKTIRELTGIGLLESKNLSEALPATVRHGLSRAAAEAMRQRFEEGVDVVVVEAGRP